MKPIKYDIYTAHHVDSKTKELPGAVFAAVIVREDGSKKLVDYYGEEDTYMTVWFDGVGSILKQIDRRTMGDELQEVIVNIHMWHTNIQSISSKLSSVYRDLKDFDQDVSRLLDRKLLKANRTKYDTHDSQVAIVSALLSMNKKVKLSVKFKPLPPKDKNMGMAYQHAELIMEDMKTEDMTG